MQVKAKFACYSIQDTTHAGGKNRKVFLSPVYGNSEENKSFAKYTPAGQLEMVIDEGTPAYDAFHPGKEYYLTFEEVPAQ